MSSTTKTLPDPPYPPEIKARGWTFDLDVERIEGSDTWALAGNELQPWLLKTWFVAWKSMPVGTMPAEPRLFAARIGMPWDQFQTAAEVLMRGWVKHLDGLLYHGVITERVLAMTASRVKDAARVATWREKQKKKLRESNALPTRDTPVTDDHVTSDQRVSTTPTPTPSLEKTTSSSSPDKLPTCPASQMIAIYHELLPDLPRVKLMTPKRNKALSSRWKLIFSRPHPDGGAIATAEQALDWWRRFLETARCNDFLMGRLPRSEAHANWKCDLDYLLTDKGLVQVVEKTEVAA